MNWFIAITMSGMSAFYEWYMYAFASELDINEVDRPVDITGNNILVPFYLCQVTATQLQIGYP